MYVTINNLQDKAIEAAISKDWDVAIQCNQAILALNPSHTDAELSLAYAYLQTHDYQSSARHYKAVLKLEPANPIAQNNLDKIEILLKKTTNSIGTNRKKNIISPESFITVSGKTKIAHLVNIGQADTLAHLHVGEEVYMQIKKRRIEIRTADNEYVGALPDDISKRLMFFLEAASHYGVYIKSALKNSVEVFIREMKKGSKVASFTSFPQNISDDLKLMMQRVHPMTEVDEEDDTKTPKDKTAESGADGAADADDDLETDEDMSSEITDIETLAQFEDEDEPYISNYGHMDDFGDDDE